MVTRALREDYDDFFLCLHLYSLFFVINHFTKVSQPGEECDKDLKPKPVVLVVIVFNFPATVGKIDRSVRIVSIFQCNLETNRT